MEIFTEDVKQFIIEHIHSVGQMEVFLLLKENPAREWNPLDVSRELRMPPGVAAARLDSLQALDLLSVRKAHDLFYQYVPRTIERQQLADLVAEAYKKRRVTVITRIYSKRLSEPTSSHS